MRSTTTVTEITSELTREVVSDAYRSEVGHGKAHSRAAMAAGTGIDVTTLDNYRDGRTAPELHNFLRVCAVLGPGFVNRVLALAGMGGAARLEPDSATILAVNAGAAELVALITQFLADDGRVCHREEAQAETAVRELHSMITDYLQARAEKRGHLKAVV